MKMSDLKRAPEDVRKALIRKGDKLITTKKMSVIIPSRLTDKSLVILGEETQVLGLFMYVLEGKKYALSNATAMMTIDPDDMAHITVDGTDCLEFTFEPNSVLLKTVHLIKSDKLLYYIYRDFISMGVVPPYMDYLSFSRIFDNAQYFNGVKLASTLTMFHMLISLVARNPKNKQQYFREVTDGKNYGEVAYEGIRSIAYGPNNDVARLVGGHFADKVTTAMISENTEVQQIEAILRS